MSDYLAQMVNAQEKNTKGSMHTGFPALVVDYNEEKNMATIQPLYIGSSGEQMPQIQNVPIAKYRIRQKVYRVVSPTGSGPGMVTHSHSVSDSQQEEEVEYSIILKQGDMVFCLCSEKSIDSIFAKQVHLPQSKRTFDLSDAVILCIL